MRLFSVYELARVSLGEALPTIGTIFLSMNGDVYIISSEAPRPGGLVSRVHLRPGWSHGLGSVRGRSWL